MNKQEALKQIEEQRDMILELHGWGVFGYIKGIINQLDEPQKIELPKVEFKKSPKVKVPQCVHKYIQEAKEYNWDLQDLMKSIDDEDSEDLQRWFYHECNQETLARAWLDGYEVEEEKRYLVRFKATKHYFDKDGNGRVYFSLAYKSCFTKKQLEEADFGWVFDCPGIEIEEVEL